MSPLLLIAFPYLALVCALLGGLYRYRADRFSFSSFSSEVLEKRALFWGSVPWHYGIILILIAHLFAALLPSVMRAILSDPLRLASIEVLGMGLGLWCLLGIVVLFARRLGSHSRPGVTTSTMDWLLLAVLLGQAATGVATAMSLRWGGRWYLDTAVPWLWSIGTFNPDASKVTALPLLVQMHMVGGFLVIALFPFTRLVHIVAVPLGYLWRPYQVVVWLRSHDERTER